MSILFRNFFRKQGARSRLAGSLVDSASFRPVKGFSQSPLFKRAFSSRELSLKFCCSPAGELYDSVTAVTDGNNAF